MTEKITHSYVCDNCGKTATRCIEQVWCETKVLPDGSFGEEDYQDAVGDSARFYCDEHDY